MSSSNQQIDVERSQKNEEPMRYGFWRFSPDIFQTIFNNAKAFVLFVTLANVLQGIIVNGLLKVNVTSIERRFNLLSSESGLIISAFDIAGCLCLLPVSYIGGRGHKPRWIGTGVLLMGIGSLILSLPKFLSGPYIYNKDRNAILSEHGADWEPICRSTNSSFNSGVCDRNDQGAIFLKQMKYVFMLGQFFNGLGNTPLGVLAITFIDENVEQRVYPVYIGIYYMGALLGPAIGFVLGGQMLTKFTNLREAPAGLTPTSPTWVGAWWVGFLVSGIITVFLSVPIFGYPRKLQAKNKKRRIQPLTPWWRCCFPIKGPVAQKDSELEAQKEKMYYNKKDHKVMAYNPELAEESLASEPMLHDKELKGSGCFQLISEFFNDVATVLQNKAFIFLSLSASIFATLVSGFSSFGPKFVESQLGKSASDAANLFGYVCIPAGAGGMLIGAFLMTWLKMSHKSALQMCIAVSLFGLLAQFVLVLDCDDLPLAGVTLPYTQKTDFISRMETFEMETVNITHRCNKACHCAAHTSFEPVCDHSGLTYYSPCHAGCTSWSENTEGIKVYSECECVGDIMGGVNYTRGSVTAGKCPSKVCRWQYLMIFSLFIVIFSTFLCTVPGVDLSLRCFPHRQRPLAIGIQWILIRTLGMIPGPIIFGSMIDGTCLLWGSMACNGHKGSCLMYKNSELSSSFLVLSVIYKAAGIVALCLAWLYVKQDIIYNDTNFKSPKERGLYQRNAPSTSRNEFYQVQNKQLPTT